MIRIETYRNYGHHPIPPLPTKSYQALVGIWMYFGLWRDTKSCHDNVVGANTSEPIETIPSNPVDDLRPEALLSRTRTCASQSFGTQNPSLNSVGYACSACSHWSSSHYEPPQPSHLPGPMYTWTTAQAPGTWKYEILLDPAMMSSEHFVRKATNLLLQANSTRFH